MLDIHAEALETSDTAYHEFLLYYRGNEKFVYGFVEGRQDPAFYRGAIDNAIPYGWTARLFQAGNKNKVLKTYQAMDWKRFAAQRVCFFVDRDLTDFLDDVRVSGDNLYVTDQYSIENEIVRFGTFERALEEILNITGMTPDERDKVRRVFEQNLDLFVTAMVPIMAQIILWKRQGHRPHLNNIEPKDFFAFVNGIISLRQGFETSHARLRHAKECCSLECSPEDILAAAEKELKEMDAPAKFIRGKYLLWFFVECAVKIHESASVFCAKHGSKPKVHVTLGPGNAMVILGPRVPLPDSLKTFIDRNYIAYIRQAEGSAN